MDIRIPMLTVVVLLISFGISKAQLTGAQSMINDVIDPTQSNSELRYGDKFEGIGGTPYLFDEWMNGNVVIKSGTKLKGVKLKYDVYSDALNFQDPSGKVRILSKSKIMSFEITNPDVDRDTLTFEKYELSGFKGEVFCLVIYDGEKWKLVNKIRKYLTEKITTIGGYNNSKSESRKFQKVNSYFLIKEDGSTIKTNNNKKSLLSVMGDQEAKLKSYIKSSKLDLKKESDMARLVQHYEELLN